MVFSAGPRLNRRRLLAGVAVATAASLLVGCAQQEPALLRGGYASLSQLVADSTDVVVGTVTSIADKSHDEDGPYSITELTVEQVLRPRSLGQTYAHAEYQPMADVDMTIAVVQWGDRFGRPHQWRLDERQRYLLFLTPAELTLDPEEPIDVEFRGVFAITGTFDGVFAADGDVYRHSLIDHLDGLPEQVTVAEVTAA